jgi:rhamnulokinase
MAKRAASVAIDLGSESCRVSLLRWKGDTPEIIEVHRFANAPIQQGNSLRWDIEAIIAGVEKGLRLCAGVSGGEKIASIGVDGWAVDYVRLRADGKPLANPYCYRDERTTESEKQVYAKISADSLYRLTGIQLLRLNTLFQLHADSRDGISQGLPWLNLPEYILHRLGGERVAEYTNASHTQLLRLGRREWCPQAFEAAGLDIHAAPNVVPPGTDVGAIQGTLAELINFKDARLIAPACHDTASAIAGIPLAAGDWAFLSSGTWSLVGTVMDSPCATDDARRKNFTNLGGAGGSTCFLKNVNGMWLLRQCLERWTSLGLAWSVNELIEECAKLPPPDFPVDVENTELLLPGNMPARINEDRRRNGFAPIPDTNIGIPAMANAIFHGLAARYAQVLADISEITGKRIKRLCIVGGGSRNLLLNRLTAERTGLEVTIGAAESSTVGNFAIQLATLAGDYNGSVGADRDAIASWAGILTRGMTIPSSESIERMRQT